MRTTNSNEHSQRLSLSNFIILGRLGRGSTSYVFKTQSIKTKKYYAMKVFDKCEGSLQDADIHRQIDINRELKHENIVEFITHLEDHENHYLVTEYCDQGQATKLLLSNSKIQMFQQSLEQYSMIMKITYQIALALNYLHNQVEIAHGDMKLGNILFTKDKIKLCDFGFSKKINSTKSANIQQTDDYVKGTLIYLSPEIIKNRRNLYPKQTDIWGLGICLLILILKKQPYNFTNNYELQKQIVEGRWIRPTSIPQKYKQLSILIERMLQINPQKRITAHQIAEHPIFNTRKVNLSQNDKNIAIIRQNNQIIDLQNIYNEEMNKSQFNCTTDSETNIRYQLDNISEILQREQTNPLQLQQQQIKLYKYSVDRKFQFNQNKIYTVNLNSQSYKMKGVNSFQIKEDKQLRIKLNKINYCIDYMGNYLLLEVPKKIDQYNSKDISPSCKTKIKKYRYQNFSNSSKQNKQSNQIPFKGDNIETKIDFDQKILHYYQYAKELITVLKKNQDIIHENVHPQFGNFYWIRRIKDRQQLQISVHFTHPQNLRSSGVLLTSYIAYSGQQYKTEKTIEIKQLGNDKLPAEYIPFNYNCCDQQSKYQQPKETNIQSKILNKSILKSNIQIFNKCFQLCCQKLKVNI